MFKFPYEKRRAEVIKGGPHHIGGRLLIIRKWIPNTELKEEVFKELPIWIKLSNVPFSLWSDEGLGYIANAAGRPLYQDYPTETKRL